METQWCWAKQHLIQAHDLSLFSALLKREWIPGKPTSKSNILYCSFFFDFSLSAGLGVPESDSYGSGRAGLGNSKIIQRKQVSLQFLTNQTVMREFHFLTDLISESMSGRSLVLLTHLRYILCRRGGQRK